MSTSKKKLGIVSFLIMDLALAMVLMSLYWQRESNKIDDELSSLGVNVFPEAIAVSSFQLTDQYQQAFSNDNLTDKWTLMFFGFTSCPDICPLTLAELKNFYLQTPYHSDTQIALVTVDPTRDGTAEMGDYVASFNPDFIGLTGNPGSISRLARQLFVTHSEPETLSNTSSQPQHAGHQQASSSTLAGDPADYLITHSGHISLINPQGQFHAVFRPPVRSRDLLRAYELIRD